MLKWDKTHKALRITEPTFIRALPTLSAPWLLTRTACLEGKAHQGGIGCKYHPPSPDTPKYVPFTKRRNFCSRKKPPRQTPKSKWLQNNSFCQLIIISNKLWLIIILYIFVLLLKAVVCPVSPVRCSRDSVQDCSLGGAVQQAGCGAQPWSLLSERWSALWKPQGPLVPTVKQCESTGPFTFQHS